MLDGGALAPVPAGLEAPDAVEPGVGAVAPDDPLADVGAAGDGLVEGTVDRDGAVEFARTPVMVGAAEVITAAAPAS